MAEKKIKTRIQNKHDTAANWEKAVKFTPNPGEIIIYETDDNNTSPKIKIGDGSNNPNNLPFLNEQEFTAVNSAIDAVTTDLADSTNYLGSGIDNLRLNLDDVESDVAKLQSDVGNAEAIIANINKEAFIEWGGQNLAGKFSPIDAGLAHRLGANRFALGKPAGIAVEYSRDGGETWSDYQLADTDKVKLLSSQTQIVVGKGTSNQANANGTLYQVRVTLSANELGVYTVLSKFIIYVSTGGFTNCWCTVERKRRDSNTWQTLAERAQLSGWSGFNVINVANTTFGVDSNNYYSHIRFTFGGKGDANSTHSGLNILSIYGYGGVGWTTPSSLARHGHIYNYDITGINSAGNPIVETTFPSVVKAGTFVGTFEGNADTADYASSANKADKDGDGNIIADTYIKKTNIESELNNLISCGTTDPDPNSSSLFYFKYSV